MIHYFKIVLHNRLLVIFTFYKQYYMHAKHCKQQNSIQAAENIVLR